MLFAYWDAVRGERAAPERGDVKPGEMRHVLADAFVLSREPGHDAAFRLAGTRLSALFGRELSGSGFPALWAASERAEAGRVVDTVGAILGLLGRNQNGSELALEMLILPLRHRGRTDARLLGAMSPAAVPSWAGLVPLRDLRTISLRVIEPGRSDAAPRGAPDDQGEPIRAVLQVGEGLAASPGGVRIVDAPEDAPAGAERGFIGTRARMGAAVAGAVAHPLFGHRLQRGGGRTLQRGGDEAAPLRLPFRLRGDGPHRRAGPRGRGPPTVGMRPSGVGISPSPRRSRSAP